MREKKNAPPAATGERACGKSRDPSSNVPIELGQPHKRTNLDAAVIAADHPEAAKSARLVPEGAHVIRLGGAVAGYFKVNGSKYVFRSCRAHEIERLFLHRHPASEGVLPQPEDEVVFARAIVAHAAPEEARAALVRWGVELTPAVERVLDDPRAWSRKFKAETLGNLLGLTEYERTRLCITTFRAAGQTTADQDEARRAKDRARKRAARARKSCGTLKPISAEQLRPWEVDGVSRRTWYRRKVEKVASDGTAGVRSNIKKRIGTDKSSATDATFILEVIIEPKSLADLVEATGLPLKTIKPILSRLKAAGRAMPVRRGVWQAIETLATGGPKAAAGTEPHRSFTTDTPPSKGGFASSVRPSLGDRHVGSLPSASIDRVATALRSFIAATGINAIADAGRARTFDATSMECRDA